ALLAQPDGDGLPDPGAAPGDDGRLPLESPHDRPSQARLRWPVPPPPPTVTPPAESSGIGRGDGRCAGRGPRPPSERTPHGERIEGLVHPRLVQGHAPPLGRGGPCRRSTGG